VFIKVPAAQIAESTPIDRSALQSSILVHRMYARLGEEGIVVQDYGGIKVFGDLMRRQGFAGSGSAGPGVVSPLSVPVPVARAFQGGAGMAPGIGIDMEEIAVLPRAADLRKEAFYLQNFTAAEMAYCILQADPYASLAGIWAAKEAIAKADASFRPRPFNTIEIGHSAEGRPEFPGFGLSISHSGGMAVAVVVREATAPLPVAAPAQPARNQASTNWILWIALLLAAAALLVTLKH
jgi:holo-[acyl-carrier protein] synthase